MNNSKTPKIVVGVGLAAVYAAGLGYFMLRGTHDSVPVQTVSAAASTQVAEPVPPPASIPAFTDTPTSAAEQPAATSVAAAPVAKVPMDTAAARPARESMQSKARSNEQTLASAAPASPAAERVIEESNPGSEGAAATSEPTNPAEEVAPQVAAVAPAEDTEVATN